MLSTPKTNLISHTHAPTTVAYGQSFLVLGGYNGATDSKDIYRVNRLGGKHLIVSDLGQQYNFSSAVRPRCQEVLADAG